jgi:hypothetical protein
MPGEATVLADGTAMRLQPPRRGDGGRPLMNPPRRARGGPLSPEQLVIPGCTNHQAQPLAVR